MLPKVRASLLKNLKPLPVKNAEAVAPSPPERGSSQQQDPGHRSSAGSETARVIPFPGGSPSVAPAESTSEPAPRNPLIEFFGRLRAQIPVLRSMVIQAYSRAAKSLKAGSRQKKGILVDRDQP